jgi:hypothetical protein
LSVEKLLDEMWVGVKCQSNVEIAGSPRNSFRASLMARLTGGRALNGLGAYPVTEPNQTPNGCNLSMGVRLWVISFIVERETAQTFS